jgi:hypothetical protein
MSAALPTVILQIGPHLTLFSHPPSFRMPHWPPATTGCCRRCQNTNGPTPSTTSSPPHLHGETPPHVRHPPHTSLELMPPTPATPHLSLRRRMDQKLYPPNSRSRATASSARFPIHQDAPSPLSKCKPYHLPSHLSFQPLVSLQLRSRRIEDPPSSSGASPPDPFPARPPALSTYKHVTSTPDVTSLFSIKK